MKPVKFDFAIDKAKQKILRKLVDENNPMRQTRIGDGNT